MLNTIVSVVIVLCWIIFVVGFIVRKKSPTRIEHKRDKRAQIGLMVEGIGYALVWFVRRESATAFLPFNLLIEMTFSIIAIILAVSSVWLILSAIRILGKQWTPAARIIEHHELITSGPYSIVRHPIYGGMFGLMVATGLAFSKPWALAAAIVIYIVGTLMRIKVEENLLTEYFGDKYTEYKRNVSAFIPFIV